MLMAMLLPAETATAIILIVGDHCGDVIWFCRQYRITMFTHLTTTIQAISEEEERIRIDKL